jgi:MscS family membrane protein
VRVAQGAGGENGVRWMFSRGTVNRIDAWYERLDQRWIYENLPPILLKSGPFELMVWQWLALPAVFFLAWLVGWMLARLSRGVLIRIARRTRVQWDDAMIAQMNGPLVLAWSLVAARLALPWLGLYAPAEAWIHRGIRAGLFLAFFWALMRGLSVAASLLGSSTWSNLNPASRSLIPLGTRVGKVLLVAVALVAMLAELGYPVASLIAGLGIGGLAVALAAQKTVENLFGAFSLGVDQPFREGDFVKIEDFVGTVEAIGLRSTRVRTLDRTVISIPNGKLAEMRLETFAARDRIRLYCKLGLVYGTPPERMRAILASLERVLRDHPKIWPDSVTVRFEAFGASSLDIEIMAWFLTQDFDEFKEIRQNLFLDFMDVVEKNGSSFAFPTRTIQLIDERHVQEPERRSRS